MAHVVRQAVSDAIQNHLQDPRIKGLITVTEVDMPPDLKSADVYISIIGTDEKQQKLTFQAIEHASGHIRSLIAPQLVVRFLPTLRFHHDDRLKKTMQTMAIFDEIERRRQEDDPHHRPESELPNKSDG